MATVSKTQAKVPVKAGQPRASAWTGSRASPTFSAAAASRPSSTNFPPLGGQEKEKGPGDKTSTEKIVASLVAVTGSAITLTTKPNTVYHGTIVASSSTAITLNDVIQPNSPSAPMMSSLTINPVDVISWSPGTSQKDSFGTDTDISVKSSKPHERELQAWQPDMPPADHDALDLNASTGKPWDQFAANESMFGVKTTFDEEQYTTKIDRNAADFKEKDRKAQQLANEILGSNSSNPHIQEERVQNLTSNDAGGEEEKYSSIPRGANAYVPPGARKAGVTAPSAPTSGSASQANATPAKGEDGVSETSAAEKDQKTPSDPTKAFRVFVDSEKERLKAKKNDIFKKDLSSKMADLVKFSQNFKLNKPMPDDLVPILAKDEERQRAIKEKSATDASSAEARAIGVSPPSAVAQPAAKSRPINAPKLPPGFKESLKNMPIPERKPKEPLKPPAQAAAAPAKPAAQAPKPKLSATGKVLIPMHIPAIPAFKGKTNPSSSTTPDAKKGDSPNGSANAAGNKLNANASSFKPNPGAKAFTPGGPSTSPKANSPKPARDNVTPTPNPFFGNKPLKKNPVHLKEDFNPFKHSRVSDAPTISGLWPYHGKRFMQMFPTIPPQQQQPAPQAQHPVPVPMPMQMGGPMMPHHVPPHMMPPHPQPNGQPSPNGQQPQQPPQAAPVNMPPPYTEDDQSGQRGYVFTGMFATSMPGGPPMHAQPPAPGQPGGPQPGQPGVQQMQPIYGFYPGMMPGMAPPPGAAYAMPPFMPPMGYGMPPTMPPGQPMYPPGMTMPPQGYAMPPPPQGYGMPQNPPATNGQQNGNGAHRPSVPPTPIPAAAHPYYHQSPQLGHAVPYVMMPPPPPGGMPPHTPYDQANGAPAPQAMGGHV